MAKYYQINSILSYFYTLEVGIKREGKTQLPLLFCMNALQTAIGYCIASIYVDLNWLIELLSKTNIVCLYNIGRDIEGG